jgi:hypothetical protein
MGAARKNAKRRWNDLSSYAGKTRGAQTKRRSSFDPHASSAGKRPDMNLEGGCSLVRCQHRAYGHSAEGLGKLREGVWRMKARTAHDQTTERGSIVARWAIYAVGQYLALQSGLNRNLIHLRSLSGLLPEIRHSRASGPVAGRIFWSGHRTRCRERRTLDRIRHPTF